MAKYSEKENVDHNWSFGKDYFDERLERIEKIFLDELCSYYIDPYVVLDESCFLRDVEAENFEISMVTLTIRFGTESDFSKEQKVDISIPGYQFSNLEFIRGVAYQELVNRFEEGN